MLKTVVKKGSYHDSVVLMLLTNQISTIEGVKKVSIMMATPANKEQIRANFDAGLKASLQRNDFHILVATDAISEGYNLHRAGAVFNYDIPYNPTRVIQRIGRINRINKKVFDELYIYNYFPTEVGETETRTKEISTLKMALIHAIMGEDTKALTKDEEVKAYCVLHFFRNCTQLLYLAVLPQMRGAGVGSLVMPLIKQKARGALVLEVEDPEEAKNEEELKVRLRRIAFYKRLGFAMLDGVRLLIPGGALRPMSCNAVEGDLPRLWKEMYAEIAGVFGVFLRTDDKPLKREK